MLLTVLGGESATGVSAPSFLVSSTTDLPTEVIDGRPADVGLPLYPEHQQPTANTPPLEPDFSRLPTCDSLPRPTGVSPLQPAGVSPPRITDFSLHSTAGVSPPRSAGVAPHRSTPPLLPQHSDSNSLPGGDSGPDFVTDSSPMPEQISDPDTARLLPEGDSGSDFIPTSPMQLDDFGPNPSNASSVPMPAGFVPVQVEGVEQDDEELLDNDMQGDEEPA